MFERFRYTLEVWYIRGRGHLRNGLRGLGLLLVLIGVGKYLVALVNPKYVPPGVYDFYATMVTQDIVLLPTALVLLVIGALLVWFV